MYVYIMYMYIIIHMYTSSYILNSSKNIIYVCIIIRVHVYIIITIVIIIRSTQLVVAKVEFSYLELVQKNTKQDAAMAYLSVR